MKTYNTYFTDFNTLHKFIKNNSIYNNEKLLIQIFTSLTKKQEIISMLKEISSLLPGAHIVGASSEIGICGKNMSHDKTVISITQFDSTKITTAFTQTCENAFDAGRQIVRQISKENTKLLITFTNGLHCNAQEYLLGIKQENADIIVTGGMASDPKQFKSTYVFTKDHISSKGAVGVGLHNNQLQIFTDSLFNWIDIGMDMTVTKVEKNRIYTIDNIPAYDIYAKYLGKEIATELPEIGLHYPLIIQKPNNKIARSVLSKHQDGSLTFGGNFNVGDLVKFGYGNSSDMIRQSNLESKKMLSKPIESIFIYSCIARYKFLKDEIMQEIEPLNKIADTAGFFTYGEFSSLKDSNELLNQTMTILALSESQHSTNSSKIVISKEIKHKQIDKSLKALSHLLNNTITALNKKYKILQDKEASLQRAQAIGHMGSWEVDIKSGISTWSKETYSIYGHDEATYIPTLDKFMQNIVDEDKPKANNFVKLLNDGKIHTVSLRAKKANGLIINILLNGQMFFNEQNEAEKIIGTTFDVTELTQIKKLTKQQTDIIEQLHDSVIITDLNDTIHYCNTSAAIMHKYTKEEMINQSIYMLYPKNELQKAHQIKQYALSNQFYHDEIQKITKTGDLIITEVVLIALKDEQDDITTIARISKDITKRTKAQEELKSKTKQLAFQAFHDNLTKLPNRALFYDRLTQSISQIKRNQQMFALLFIDLDNFKQINDTLGHNIGDEVLKISAQRLRTCIREQDTLSRLGGDEFTIILQDIKHINIAAKIAKKIIKLIAEKIIIDNTTLYTACSIGISIAPNDTLDKDDLIKYADSAMYHAKSKGRNTYRFYSTDMTRSAVETIELENSMRTAVQDEQFLVYYQPQIDINKNKIIGSEALVRWQHPTLGFISPDRFIPLAETNGLITLIDNYVMERAMSDYMSLYNSGLNPGKLSLNLSTKVLNSTDFIAHLEQTLQQSGFDPIWLEFEVTETQLMENPKAAIEKLNLLNQMGIKISIDDFGTGHSSLSYLRQLPVKKLKIDKSFIDEIPDNEDDCTISKAVIALANSLDLEAIAEGVETKEQNEFLRQHQCHLVQGYHYSRPIAINELRVFIKKYS